MMEINMPKSLKRLSAATALAGIFAAMLTLPVQAKPGAPILKIGNEVTNDVYLQSLDIKVEVMGGVASTRYTMVFKNRTNRALEGVLTFPLPDGVTATHYALDIQGAMRTAMPVDKGKAARVFEEIQLRPIVRERDPGILEKIEGNNFRTRVYPIWANGARTISIGYEEELTLEDGHLYYRLPMTYAAPIEKVSVSVIVWQASAKPVVPPSADPKDRNAEPLRFDKDGIHYVASFVKNDHRPDRALVFALPAPLDAPSVVMQNAEWIMQNEKSKSKETAPTTSGATSAGESDSKYRDSAYYFLASVAPDIAPRKKNWSGELAIIWDVSLSGAERDPKREIEMLDIIFKEKKNASVHLYFLNNKFSKSVNKNTANGEYKVSGGKWEELKTVLQTAVYDGGTDLSQIDPNGITGNEALFFSDGISTLSDADFLKKGQAESLRLPIHCVVSSPKADYAAMRNIAAKTGGKFINLNALTAQGLKDELLTEPPRYLGAEYGNNVSEVYPSIATPVRGNFSVTGIFNAECIMQNAEWKVKSKDKKSESLEDKSRAGDNELTLLFGFGNKVEKRIKVTLDDRENAIAGKPTKIPDTKKKPDANTSEHTSPHDDCGTYIRKIWAQKKIAELDLDYKANRTEITELGNRFGIVTRNTSLMVLEIIDDYIRYEIEPPPELREVYRRRLNTMSNRPRDMAFNLIDEALTAAESLRVWRDAVHSPPPPPSPPDDGFDNGARRGGKSSAVGIDAIFSDIDAAISNVGSLRSGGGVGRKGASGVGFGAGSGSGFGGGYGHGGRGGGRGGGSENDGAVSIGGVLEQLESPIKVKEIKKDRDYLKLMTGDAAADHRSYLKIKNEYDNSPTFYFDMAEWFYSLKDKETAVRILTSIAELDIGNARLYRLLGYKLKDWGEYAIQKFVCQKVVEWRPMEPQSHRDYALALADAGEQQAALDSLYGTLTRYYSQGIRSRSYNIAEAIVMEMNRLIVKYPNLKTSRIDSRLLIDPQMDVRVVMNWIVDSVDIDLHVVDPNWDGWDSNKEYSNIGGRVSRDDFTGYGPEQFILRNAIKGKYKILINHVSSRGFTWDGPATVMVEIYLKYADKNERRQVISFQLDRVKKVRRGKVEIAEFEL